MYVPSEVQGTVDVNAPLATLDRATLTMCKDGQCTTTLIQLAGNSAAECVGSAHDRISCNATASAQTTKLTVHYDLDGVSTSPDDVYTITIQPENSLAPLLSQQRHAQYRSGEPNGHGCGGVTTGTI